MKRIALITGASAGIGKASAEKLAQEGYDLILFARRLEKLEILAESLKEQYRMNCHIAKVDVRDKNSVSKAVNDIPESFKNINVLINNAGLAAGLSSIEDGQLENWDTMLDTNVKGLLYVSKACIPLLKNQDYAHIINIGSIAAKDIYMNGNVYCASKHAVDALTQSMRLELSEYPIKVTGIHPGAVETEFSEVRFNGDKARAKAVYEGFDNLVASDIADAIAWVISRPQHVNINDLVIMPTAQPKAGVLHKRLQ
mgnify:CR=1 FL=1